ncbi:MAG: type II toxin-antitoxin system RelE/ParE family toxin [Selenomonadaceae bacterium]|nr:type II toxin-antitoxin system RelE/ParE family toxin [Selenomonadaceae bacterium]
MKYNTFMKNLLIPQVIVETPAYLNAVEEFWDTDTQTEFKNFIGVNFLLGDIIPNTGGLRKIRWKGTGKGKRSGARVIYYFYDEHNPIYLLFAYSKNVQTDLTEHEKKLLRHLVSQLKNSFRSKETNVNAK